MDYKSIFDKAMSWKLSEYTFSENKVLRNIEERAKKMEKSKETKYRIFGVVGGIAGAAAVLAGAVFGLNWLNEHGGLKEGGIESSNGAGYHEDMTEPAQSEAETTEAMTVSKAKTEVPATFELRTSAVTVIINSYEFDGKTLNLNWDVLFDNELEKYYNPEKNLNLLVNGMKNMDAFPFMGEPDENLKHIFTVTNSFSVPERIKNCSMTVELENPADSIDLIIPPTVHDDFDVPEYTFTATVNADNVQPAVNENTGKMIYDSGIEWEKYAVAIPDGTRYKFNGFVVEPRWCYFDGIKVRIAYDIIGENPDISKINVSGNEAEVTGYELYRSEDRILMMSDLTYPEARSTVYIDFIDVADGTKYTLPIKAPECVAVSAELKADYNCFQSFYIPPEEDRKSLTDAHVETEKCDIKVNWLAFDGMTLVLQYDVTFKNGLPEDGSVVPIWAFGDNTEKPYTTHGSRVDKLGANGDTVSYIGEIVYNRVIFDEPIKIYFMDDHTWASEVFIPFDEKNTGIIVFMPEELPSIGTSTYNIGKEVTLLSGKKINVESVTLGDYSVMITFDCETVVGFDTHDTYLVMNDGSIIDLDSLENKGGTLVENSQNIYHFILSENLNIAQVKEIYVCGECVYGENEPIPTMQQEELPVETTAEDIEAETTE
ncbi:MAG: hypothetical protein IK990_03650 [Ruminiclostridium sp.]|nr:hypothetical protein [Ruminiclostridium sp.]